ncbi:diguanylate cyclase [Massilia sp. UMI-21]|nr:diguanylate cyclase [Massilia sp. UMI-21]
MGYRIDTQVSNFTDLLLDAVCVVDAGGKFVFVSAAGERIFGYTLQEMVGKAVADLVLPADRERTLAAAQAVMRGRSHIHFENRYLRKDGSIVHIMWSARWSETDRVRVAVARDVTELKQAQAVQAALYALSEAAHVNEDLAGLFQRSHEIIGELLPAAGYAVALRDGPGDSLRFAHQVCDIRLETPMRSLCEAVVARQAPMLLAPSSEADGPPPAPGVSMLAVPLPAGQSTLGALVLHGTSGGTYSHQDRNLLLFVANQLAAAIQRKQLQAGMHFMAMHDELTHLPNRRLFHDRLGTALARAQRQHTRLALLFIDLNRFKQVNDQHGHLVGDRLLQQVAHRIAACVRDSDTLARLGGDEFVALLENIVLPEDAAPVVDKIRQALSAPFALGDGLVLATSASIGVAHYPEHGDNMQELMSRADQAMYDVKQAAAGAPAMADTPALP